MSTMGKIILTAAIVGGAAGVVGAALYVRWRVAHRTLGERASSVLRQLSDVADRMERTLAGAPANPQVLNPQAD